MDLKIVSCKLMYLISGSNLSLNLKVSRASVQLFTKLATGGKPPRIPSRGVT